MCEHTLAKKKYGHLEAAILLGITSDNLTVLVNKGTIKCVRVGKQPTYSAEELCFYLTKVELEKESELD